MDSVEKSKNKKFDEEAFLDSLSPQELRDFARVGVRFTARFAIVSISRILKALKSTEGC